jgi:hypothetical protein
MRHLATPPWVVLAAAALIGHVAIVMVALAAIVDNHGETLRALNEGAAVVVGGLIALPTLVLAGMSLIRRLARVVAVIAGGWPSLLGHGSRAGLALLSGLRSAPP